MMKYYVKMALLWGGHPHLDDKIIEKLEKEYIEYQKNESWEIMENELTKYIESISISEIINFISALKEEVINTKLRHKDKLGEAIISIIFGFFYGGFIQDSSLKYVHNIKIKQCLFNILNELENGVKTNDYVEEKIISYRHKIYRGYKGLSHKQYFELFEKNFKERDNYKGLYYWYGEFLD